MHFGPNKMAHSNWFTLRSLSRSWSSTSTSRCWRRELWARLSSWFADGHHHCICTGCKKAAALLCSVCWFIWNIYVWQSACACICRKRVYGEQRRALNALQQEFRETVSHPNLTAGSQTQSLCKAAMLLTIEPSLSLQLSRTWALCCSGWRDGSAGERWRWEDPQARWPAYLASFMPKRKLVLDKAETAAQEL